MRKGNLMLYFNFPYIKNPVLADKVHARLSSKKSYININPLLRNVVKWSDTL